MNPSPDHDPGPREKGSSSGGEEWVAAGTFLGSILSGTLLGYLADLWLGTKPWLVVIGILLGSSSGFVRMWHLSKSMERGRGER
ncbi:MAG: AtpZ/AtpI family protein [Actinomycetota bacterium]